MSVTDTHSGGSSIPVQLMEKRVTLENVEHLQLHLRNQSLDDFTITSNDR